jgi:hypothetical protein
MYICGAACTGRGCPLGITIVEWASFAAIQKAREAAAAKHREMNLNPQEMFERLQIKAEFGNYVPVGSA